MCRRCGVRIKVRSFSTAPEIEDVLDAVFEWMNQEGARRVAERRQCQRARETGLNELRRLIAEVTHEETRSRILLFDQVFRDAVTNAVRRELNLIRRNGLSGQ